MTVQQVSRAFKIKLSIQNFSLVLWKSVWRDLVTYSRYKVRLMGWFLNILIGVFVCFLMGRLFSFNPISSSQTGMALEATFLFLVSGFAIQIFSDVGIWGPISRVEYDIYFGTLESVFVSPASRIAYLLSPTISEAIVSLIFFFPPYILALAINGALTKINVIGWTLFVAFLTLLSLMALGLLFAMLAILIRQTTALASALYQIFQFLCGLYVPVQAYVAIHPIGGKILQYFAMAFPYTYCYDLMRYYMIGETFVTLLPVWLEYVLIIGISTLFIITGAFALKFVERKAKKAGLAIL